MENIEKINIILKSIADWTNLEFSEHYNDTFCTFHDKKFSLTWKTGEDVGGNCFGGVAQFNSVPYIIPEFEKIEEFLILLDYNFPLRSYLQFKKMITNESQKTNDYYNNSTHSDIKYFVNNDFLDLIIEAGLEKKFEAQFESLNLYFLEQVNKKNNEGKYKKQELLNKAYKIK